MPHILKSTRNKILKITKPYTILVVRYSKKGISYIQTDRELSNFVQSITNYSQFRGQAPRQQNTTKQRSERFHIRSQANRTCWAATRTWPRRRGCRRGGARRWTGGEAVARALEDKPDRGGAHNSRRHSSKSSTGTGPRARNVGSCRSAPAPAPSAVAVAAVGS